MKSNSFLSNNIANIPPRLLIPFLFSLLLSFSNISYADNEPNSSIQTSKAININSADAQTIAKALKGVGLKKAEAIVDYRERYGEFARLEELVAVKGISRRGGMFAMLLERKEFDFISSLLALIESSA
ncbi:hypothetical protein A3729_08635 [Oleiphilus sp. HI0043]|uniref:ComEA family DNA-binding protein n=1 Tax=Oleiphilus sp. HI0043 TaxID=1822233 RepID=UPI0007C2FE70|nr:helix-hairpin-helix domain-containing protein [Oleiphilus sp. HI0043]KZY31951.1 hypothetical protein A3729_08635 [Oleiphilus sp. HI0043]